MKKIWRPVDRAANKLATQLQKPESYNGIVDAARLLLEELDRYCSKMQEATR